MSWMAPSGIDMHARGQGEEEQLRRREGQGQGEQLKRTCQPKNANVGHQFIYFKTL